MKKRILALTLAAIMVFALLGGCSSNTASTSEVLQTSPAEQASADVTTPNATQAQESQATAAPDQTQSGDASDTRRPIELPLTDEPVTFTYWIMSPGGAVSMHAPNGYFDYIHFQKAAELTGVYLDFSNTDFMTASEKFNLMIVSQDYADIICNFSQYYSSGPDMAIEEDIIIPLNDLIDEYAPNYNYYRTQTTFLDKATKSLDGNVTAFYELFSDSIGPFFGAIIRQDWLDNLGLDKPETYDEYHDVLTAFKTEYNCSQPIYFDQNLVGNDNFFVGGYGITSFIGGNNAMMSSDRESYWYMDGDTVKCGLVGPEYKEYLQMCAQWVDEGLISRDFITAAGTMSPQGVADVSNGDVGIFFNGAPMMSMYYMSATDPDFHLTAIKDAVKVKGDKVHVDSTFLDFGGERMTITTACPDPALAVKFGDFWFTDEGINLANYGVEGLTWEMVDGKPQYTEMVTNNPEIAAGDAISLYTGRNSTPSWASNSKLLISFGPDEAEAFSIWESSRDNANTYPSIAAMTQAEREELALLSAEYLTYAQEMRAKFAIGAESLDNYDQYEKIMYDLGIARAIELKQIAYDRYMAE